MDIERIDIPYEGISFGLSLNQKYGQLNCNMFALNDSQDGLVSDNLWRVAQFISQTIIQSVPVDDIQWSFTAGYKTTDLSFVTLNHRPLKIDVRDQHVFEYEKSFRTFSLEVYQQEFAGQPPTHIANETSPRRAQESKPVSVFTIPCSNLFAKDDVFHCQPSYYDMDRKRDEYEFILADTKKMVAQLKQHDPRILHEADKFAGDGAERLLDSTSFDSPHDTGIWCLTRDGLGITTEPNQSQMIQLVRELNIPFFPIAVDKHLGRETIAQIRSAIDYTKSDVSRLSLMRPTFGVSHTPV